jgi:hypothetical protein
MIGAAGALARLGYATRLEMFADTAAAVKAGAELEAKTTTASLILEPTGIYSVTFNAGLDNLALRGILDETDVMGLQVASAFRDYTEYLKRVAKYANEPLRVTPGCSKSQE